MYMQINNKMLRALRKKHAWSQSELAELTGLSLRTVQRIEKSGTASLESVKALSAVYELKPELIQLAPVSHQETSELNEKSNNSIPIHASFRLSDQAIQLSLLLFLLTSVGMLFMLLTHIPNVNWIHTVRLALFSETLPELASLIINLTIGALPLLILSRLAGFCWDLYKQQGGAEFIRQRLKRPFPIKLVLNKLQTQSRQAAFLLKKPVLFSGLLFTLTVGALGLTMEPYQKANFKRLIVHISHIGDKVVTPVD